MAEKVIEFVLGRLEDVVELYIQQRVRGGMKSVSGDFSEVRNLVGWPHADNIGTHVQNKKCPKRLV